MIMKEYENYKEEEIINLYQQVGWTNYTEQPKMLKMAYANSLKIVGAYVEEKLVGIIRVVGDGHSIVYIQDILVLPEYQRQGIGSSLLKKVLEIYAKVYQKVLLTDNTEKTIAFYKSMGMMMDAETQCAAFWKVY